MGQQIIFGGTTPVVPTGEPPIGTPIQQPPVGSGPVSSASPVTPGSTSSWQDWLKWGISTGVDYYKAKNATKSPSASSSPLPVNVSITPTDSGVNIPTAPQQEKAGVPVDTSGSNLPIPLILAGVGGIVLLILLMRK